MRYDKKCKRCGKDIFTVPFGGYNYARTNGNFCSYSCKMLWDKGRKRKQKRYIIPGGQTAFSINEICELMRIDEYEAKSLIDKKIIKEIRV